MIFTFWASQDAERFFTEQAVTIELPAVSEQTIIY